MQLSKHDLYEIVDYLWELQGLQELKKGSTLRNMKDMAELQKLIDKLYKVIDYV